MISEPMKSDYPKDRVKKDRIIYGRKKFGIDVYVTSIIEVLGYGVLIYLYLDRLRKSEIAPIDLVFFKLLLAAFIHPIIGSIKSIRNQWQTNASHQRTNKLKKDLEMLQIQVNNQTIENKFMDVRTVP